MYGISSYRSQRKQTASPAQVVAMLFVELARRIESAASCLDVGDKLGAAGHLHHAREILTELQMALDPVPGAEPIVANLRRVYDWAFQELIAVSGTGDAAQARAVGRALEPLVEAWTAIQGSV